MRNNEKETHDGVGTALGTEMCDKADMTASAIPISGKTLATEQSCVSATLQGNRVNHSVLS